MRSWTIAVLAGLLTLPACQQQGSAQNSASPAGKTASLDKAIASVGDLSIVSAGLRRTGLSTVFDGNASYTVLAPTDDAFKALGDKAAPLTAEGNGAALAAVLRDHIVPGTLTPTDIDRAIGAAKGDPVKMRTVGNAQVTFTKTGGTITVTGSDGSSARFAGAPVTAKNGVAIPIDAVLKKL